MSLGARIANRFALDLRSLALFRIAAGATLCGDVLVRSRDFVWHYGEHGILPRATFLAEFKKPWDWSLHALVASDAWMAGLFVLQALLGIALALGIFTRAVTALCYLLALSLDNRNPYVLSGGDTLLRVALFFAFFLPLGARASLDARRAAKSAAPAPTAIASMAAVAFVLQAMLVYEVSGVHKLLDPVWRNLDGALRSFTAVQFSTELGGLLGRYRWLGKALSAATIALEVLGPVAFLFARPRLRLGLCFAFIGFHVSCVLTLRLGIFPAAGVVLWAALLPAYFWDEWLPRFGMARFRESAERLLPAPSWAFARTVPALAIGLVAFWLSGLPRPDVVSRLVRMVGLAQGWKLFTPPANTSGWIVAPARRADGTKIDALSGRPLVWGDPGESDRDRKLRTLAISKRRKRMLRLMERGVCRRSAGTVTDFKIVYVKHWRSGSPGKPPTRKVLRRGRCKR